MTVVSYAITQFFEVILHAPYDGFTLQVPLMLKLYCIIAAAIVGGILAAVVLVGLIWLVVVIIFWVSGSEICGAKMLMISIQCIQYKKKSKIDGFSKQPSDEVC